jgi:hypothetical protein
VDFYREHRDGARNAEYPEELKQHLLALLHWKDGKARGYIPGEKHAKPNILKPICTLSNIRLSNFTQLFRDLAHADKNDVMTCTKRVREKLKDMWVKETVVIPAFILHVARPDWLPIIDQHTIRAWLALTKGKVIIDSKNSIITWGIWEKYKAFFQKVVEEVGYYNNIEERCKVDRALFAWGKSLKNSARSKPDARTDKPTVSPLTEVEQIGDMPSFWGQQVPNTRIIPPACNVLQALQDYLDIGTFYQLPQHKKQNLRDLQFRQCPQPKLHEFLQNPGGNIARQFLQYYKLEMGGENDIMNLPRPIRDVFLVGWANMKGIVRTSQIAIYLYKLEFGGTQKASMAAVQVGKTTGLLFGLLDGSGTPTALFHEYFGV